MFGKKKESKQKWRVRYQETVLRECEIEADSREEAYQKANDGEFENSHEIDSSNFEVVDIRKLV